VDLQDPRIPTAIAMNNIFTDLDSDSLSHLSTTAGTSKHTAERETKSQTQLNTLSTQAAAAGDE